MQANPTIEGTIMTRRAKTYTAQVKHNYNVSNEVKLLIDEISNAHGVTASMTFCQLSCNVYLVKGPYDIFGSKQWESKRTTLASSHGCCVELHEGNDYVQELVNVLKSANWSVCKYRGVERRIAWRIYSCSAELKPYITTKQELLHSDHLRVTIPHNNFSVAYYALMQLENLHSLLQNGQYAHDRKTDIFQYMIDAVPDPAVSSKLGALQIQNHVYQPLQDNQLSIIVDNTLVTITSEKHHDTTQ